MGQFEIRPQPTTEQQDAAADRIDWDKPVGYAHATSLITLAH